MDHPDLVDTSNAASFPAKQKDPVCGMDVDPANAGYQTQRNGKGYFFCSAGCLAKFQANPDKILSSAPTPMGSGLVSLAGPALVMPAMGTPAVPNAQSPGDPGRDTRAHVGPTYVCPMCPEVRQIPSVEWRSTPSRRRHRRPDASTHAQCIRKSCERSQGIVRYAAWHSSRAR